MIFLVKKPNRTVRNTKQADRQIRSKHSLTTDFNQSSNMEKNMAEGPAKKKKRNVETPVKLVEIRETPENVEMMGSLADLNNNATITSGNEA